MNTIGGPATGLHLIRVQTPELQLVLEQRAANVGRIMEFARPTGTNDRAVYLVGARVQFGLNGGVR